MKCVSARTEAAFHGALNRRLALELTREPGERTGVMADDGGAVDEIAAPRRDRHEPEWKRAMAEKFFWQRGEGLRKIGSRRRPRNKLGFALQMCVLRYQGGLLGSDVFVPPDVADFIGRQVDLDADDFVDLPDMGVKEPPHLIEEPSVCFAVAAVDPQSPHEHGKRLS